MLRSKWLINKEEVVAEHGVVVASHPLAAEAGLEMLMAGGNAIDAAVATSFTVLVLEPWWSCLGGIGFMLVHSAERDEQVVVDYGPRAPRAARPDMFELTEGTGAGFGFRKVKDDANLYGYLSPAVPGVPAGLCLAHQRYGKLPLAQVLEPAIHYAEEGFEPSWLTVLQIAMSMEGLAQFPELAKTMLPGGFPPVTTETGGTRVSASTDKLKQRDLGQTLRLIARRGSDAFYKGELAEAIHADMRRNSGIITRDDLAAYEARVLTPAKTTYRGYEVCTSSSPCGGLTVLETLNILENPSLAPAGHNTVQSLHLFIEAARLAYADRYRYLGDPEFEPVPLRALLSKEYAQGPARKVDPSRASFESEREIEPWIIYQNISLNDPWQYEAGGKEPGQSPKGVGGDPGGGTTHIGAVDKDHNVVSATQTAMGQFGSKVVIPGTGILLNNGMMWFNPEPGTVNSIAPWKRPLTNMCPLLVMKDGKPFMSLGAPGGRRIMNAVTQILSNVVDHGLGIQAAIAAPRIDCSGKETLADARLPAEVVEALAKRGHNMQVATETFAGGFFSRPVGILIHPETGRLHGGVDIFRPSTAVGY